MLRLGVLDQSPVVSGRTGADALAETVELAAEAESLGYHRFWVAEHHGTVGLAGSAPEVMVARVASATKTIRVGSGGVLLAHANPLKVAEAFRVLHALFPGRIDLGVGRAAGASAATEAALANGAQPDDDERFAAKLADLVGLVEDRVPSHLAGVRAMPTGPAGPEVWVLASSSHGGDLAAGLGLALCFGHFITPRFGPQVAAAYRRAFRPAPGRERPRVSVAVSVVCADTDAEAEEVALGGRIWRLARQPERGPVPTGAEARSRRLDALERARVDQDRERSVVGDPARVRSALTELVSDFGADELVVVTVCADAEARRRSYRLVAEAME